MRIIQNISKVVSKLLGIQVEKKDTQYRYISYCVSSSISAGTLLYNTLTQELVQISETELSSLETRAYLIEHWFWVPYEFDDFSLYESIFSCQKGLCSTNGISRFTILPTTHCNARCSYCFENGRPQSTMSDNTAQQVAQFIQRKHDEKPVHLLWFGGEPLVNQRAIKIITSSLSDMNIPFYSSMVTNGYLFNPNNIKEAAVSWNLKLVQITLDGREEEYNKTKQYVNANANPYQTILSNIEGLLHENIRVKIRLNISSNNSSALLLLVDELYSRFGSNALLNIYAAFLEELKNTLSEMDVQQYIYLQSKISGYGYAATATPLVQSLPLNRCMADDPASIVINPDGYLSKCEYAYHHDWCGHVSSDIVYKDISPTWLRHIYPTDSCNTCQLRPLCYPLAGCVDSGFCSDTIKRIKMFELQQKMFYKYRNSVDKQK